MRKKFTMLLASMFLCMGAWAQTATIEVSTNVANPEHVYAMKNANSVWMTSYTSTTDTKPGRFAFFASGEDYQIYSIDRQKWVSYTKADSYDNGTNKVVLADAQADANVWKATLTANGDVAVYQFAPYKNSGVASIYMNWYYGLSSNPLDNTDTTVGFYGTNAGGDKGSAWILTELAAPVAGTKYVLQDKCGTYLDINNLGYEGNYTDVNQMATLNALPQPLYVTANAYNKWKIHTTSEGGSYLCQYTGGKQTWDSWVSTDGQDFEWQVELTVADGNLYYMLNNTAGSNKGYLGCGDHVNGAVLYANQGGDPQRLKLTLKEYQEGYTVSGPEGTTVTYNETVYAVGETILPEGELTVEDLSVTAPERDGYKVVVSVDNANSAVVVSYAQNLQAGHKIILKNKQHNTYLGVKFEGGKLDNSTAPTTKYLTGYTTNNTYKNCWELVAAKYNEEDCFYLYNPYYDWYASPISVRNGRIGLSKGTEGAGCFQIETKGDYIVFKCMTYANEEYQYLHQVDWRTYYGDFFAVDWTADAGASQWTFEVVSEATESSWLTAITTEVANKKAYLEASELGSGIGQYSGIAAEDKDVVLAALAIPAEGTTAEKIKAGVHGLYPLNSLAINMPTAGFYRIKSMNNGDHTENVGKCWQVNAAGTGMELNATADQFNSILYYSADRTFLSYGTGLHVNTYYNPEAVGTAATAWTIAENNKVVGTYALYRSGDGYCLSDWTGGVTYGQNDANAAWIFEEVTSLPVAVSAAGYATLYAPVALKVPAEGVTAHTVTIDGDKAILSEALEVIPAETGVILVGTEGTHNFTVTTTNETATSALAGTFAKTYVKGPAYVLSAPTVETVGLYKAKLNKNGEGNAVAEGETGTHFLNNAFKAYLPAPVGSEAPMFSFGRGEGTTGIDNAQLTIDNVVIYDLLGRRVEKMEKGIYIVNGKKVIK